MKQTFFAALVVMTIVLLNSMQAMAAEGRPLVLHVKTALSVDDAQICVVPNVAWAALSEGRPVTIVFDGSAVTSIAKGFGWRGWIGLDSTAMDRAALPERERVSLSEQFGIALEKVPHDYGEHLNFIAQLGAKVVYNRTMAVLYQIPADEIDPVARAVGLKELHRTLQTEGDYLVY